jgi:hypothetical protein
MGGEGTGRANEGEESCDAEGSDREIPVAGGTSERGSSDQEDTPTPGCFVDGCENKGDAGAIVRMYVNRKGLGEI